MIESLLIEHKIYKDHMLEALKINVEDFDQSKLIGPAKDLLADHPNIIAEAEAIVDQFPILKEPLR